MAQSQSGEIIGPDAVRPRWFGLTAGHPAARAFHPRRRTLPLWSPEVRYLFDPALPPPEIARRLRATGIGFVLLNTGSVNERFLARSAFFRDPAGALQRVWFDADMVLLRVTPAASP